MKIFVLGASGHTGRLIVEALLANKHEVMAAVHKSKKNIPEGAVAVTVDINDATSLRTAMEGCDGVVSALSSWHAPEHNVLSSAMKNVIPEMDALGIKRIVTISGDVAKVPGEKENILMKMAHLLAVGVVKKVLIDSDEHIRALSESSLDWTVVRPTIMTKSKRTSYTLQLRHPLALAVPQRAVARAVAELVVGHEYIRKGPFIS